MSKDSKIPGCLRISLKTGLKSELDFLIVNFVTVNYLVRKQL